MSNSIIVTSFTDDLNLLTSVKLASSLILL